MSSNQLTSAIACGAAFLDDYSGPGAKTLPYKTMRAVFKNAAEKAQGSAEHFEFTWQDIADDRDFEDEGKRLKRNLKDALKRWSSHEDLLNEIASDHHLDYRPVIEQLTPGGGSGNLSRYRIRSIAVDQSKVIEQTAVPDGFIRYSLEQVEEPNAVARAVNKIVMKGVMMHAMAFLLFIPIVFGLLVFLGGVLSIQWQESTVGLLKTLITAPLTLGGLYLMFSPLYFCVTKRIIVAPTALTPSSMWTAQLEYSPTKDFHNNGRPVRRFQLVSYVSKCSICGGRIEVENGYGQMKGRLIGLCSNSPREHVYTFDHQTRLGTLVHAEYRNALQPSPQAQRAA